MTRDFNKQQRDDPRPPFRDKPSYNNGEERPPRPGGRPRLNRETVDRAWESGAQRTHADYRTRSNNGQPPRNNWRNQQSSDYSSSQNNRDGSRPYNNNRQDNYRDNPRRFERTSNDSYGQRGPGARSFGPGPNNTGRQQYNDSRPGERRNYGDQANGTGPRPDYRRDNGRPGYRDDQFRGQNREHDNRRDFERNSPPYGRQGPGGPRDAQPDTRAPRWQNNRTATPRENAPYDRQGPPARGPRNEQFKGDYERFDSRDNRPTDRRDAPPRQGNYPNNRVSRGGPGRDYRTEERPPEQHVTRLPNGRVLKGPRPVQRQEAKFWTEVANDTDGLIEQIHVAPPAVEETVQVEGSEEAPDDTTENKAARKPRTRSASATVRGRKGAKEKPTVAKPSQRGYKWPSSEE